MTTGCRVTPVESGQHSTATQNRLEATIKVAKLFHSAFEMGHEINIQAFGGFADSEKYMYIITPALVPIYCTFFDAAQCPWFHLVKII